MNGKQTLSEAASGWRRAAELEGLQQTTHCTFIKEETLPNVLGQM